MSDLKTDSSALGFGANGDPINPLREYLYDHGCHESWVDAITDDLRILHSLWEPLMEWMEARRAAFAHLHTLAVDELPEDDPACIRLNDAEQALLAAIDKVRS